MKKTLLLSIGILGWLAQSASAQVSLFTTANDFGQFNGGAGTVYLATKRSYEREVQALTRAAVELSATGLLQELSVNVVEGPDDYLYGEEKALLEVIEGRDPLPRLLPPYELGLFATDSAIGIAHIYSTGAPGLYGQYAARWIGLTGNTEINSQSPLMPVPTAGVASTPLPSALWMGVTSIVGMAFFARSRRRARQS